MAEPMNNSGRAPSWHHDASAMRPVISVGVLLHRAGTVLLGRRTSDLAPGSYGWCGGGVEFGESLEEAARREVWEESGLELSELTFLSVSTILAYERHYVDVEFTSTTSQEPVVRSNAAIKDWAWYPKDHLPEPLFPAAAVALAKARSTGVL